MENEMKILFVSDNPIKGFGGGSVENRKHYDALKRYCESTDADLKVISRDVELSDTLGIAVQKNRSLDILARLAGHSTYLYFTWIYNINLIKNIIRIFYI